ncbi:MAG: hypothetical protein AAF611_14050 [Bacteroidota bacterium]
MKKIIPILAFVSFLCTIACSPNTQNLTYYFCYNDTLYSIKKVNDSIHSYRCDEDFNCESNPIKSYKIINSKQENEFALLSLERVDSIHSKRFSIMGIQQFTKNSIKIVHEITRYSKDAIAKIHLTEKLVNKKFGLTYYEENFLKSLPKDFKMTQALSDEISNAMETSYGELLEWYENTKIDDYYKEKLLSEVIGRELVKRKLSPIGFANKKISREKKE